MTERETGTHFGARTMITRRRFLAASSAIALGGLLAACGGSSSATDTPKPAGGTSGTTAPAPTAAGASAAAGSTTATQAPASASTGKPIKGTELTILWLPPSLQEEIDIQTKNMDDWASGSGVKLTKNTVSLDQLDAQLATYAQTKQGVDLTNLYAQHVATNENVMTDITGLANTLNTTLGGWYDGPKSVCIRANNQWKALPAAIYGQYWVYRQDLFTQAGITTWPATWEDLHQAGKKLKAAGTPVGFPLGHAVTDGLTHAYSLMWDYGAKEFEADGKTIALNSKEMLDCLTFFQTFYHDACAENALAWDDSGNNNAYNSGQIAVTNNANTIYTGLLKTNADLASKSTHGATLAGPAGTFQYMSMLYWGIPTYAKNPDAARAYLTEGFYTKDFQTAWTKAGNGYNLPPFGLLETVDAAWPTDPKLALARTLGKTTRMAGSPGPYTSVVGAADNKFIITDTFAKVAQGTSPKDAIAFAVNEYSLLLKGQ
ncbi:MAG: extracellular solute-binding protein [Chloroflexota bacterium]|nr:extracellular solute-binding protein [Chloroflexota bacterium]